MLIQRNNTTKVKKATSIFVTPVPPPSSNQNSNNKLKDYRLLKPENIQPGRYKAELVEALEVTDTYHSRDNTSKTWESTDLELYYDLTTLNTVAVPVLHRIKFRYFKGRPQYESLQKTFTAYNLAQYSFDSLVGLIEEVEVIFPADEKYGMFVYRKLIKLPPTVPVSTSDLSIPTTEVPTSDMLILPSDEELPF